jgi:hypothetical protein
VLNRHKTCVMFIITTTQILLTLIYKKGLVKMKRIVCVSPEYRAVLKKRVDVIGRQHIADTLDFRYTTITHKLNGQLPLSQEDYDRLSCLCCEIEGKS